MEGKNKKNWKWILLVGIAVVVLALVIIFLSKCSKEDKEDTKAGTSEVTKTPEPSKEENASQPEDSGKTETGNGILNTLGLTETGNGYEGIEGTGDYNYGEALQKSLLFYELQRSGDLPEVTRCNWRGDSALEDGADHGVDLTGGWYDAGDNMKLNLPMAYTASVLGWSLYEDYEVYEESGQLSYALANLKWANDYLIKCHTEDYVYYYQVGNGGADHGWWGPCEVMTMDRPSYAVTLDHPGSSVVAETAASLAVCGLVYQKTDAEYAKTCIDHAKKLYEFAEKTSSDDGYLADGAATAYYNIFSGFEDELTWAAAWLYLATGEDTYLVAAKKHEALASDDYKWAMCWDDVHLGAQLLLARITGEDEYKDSLEKNLDFWTTGTDEGEKIAYSPKGLAVLDTWGSLRYATTQAFVAMVYAESDICEADKKAVYQEFAKSQVNYALGSSGRSFVVGFGEGAPVNPHHRTAQGSYCDNQSEPATQRHTLYGALVGGPDSGDNYRDVVSDFNCNEVACDYNAGFTGALVKLYAQYHGQTLIDFGAVEPVEEELSCEACVNVTGEDFIEIRAYVYNKSSWPARKADSLKLRYYLDLSEVYAAGGSAEDAVVSTNYMEAGVASGVQVWDAEHYIFYVEIDFSDADIMPGSQSSYKKEVQFRMRNEGGVWDNSNDPSFACLTGNNGSQLVGATSLALYENGKLCYGQEPTEGGKDLPVATPTGTDKNPTDKNPTEQKPEDGKDEAGNQTTVVSGETKATQNGITVTNTQPNKSAKGGTIAASYTIRNDTGEAIDLAKLKVHLKFTKEEGAEPAFWCDYAAAFDDNGSYLALDGIKCQFQSAAGTDCDTDGVVTFSNGGELADGGSVTLQLRITKEDWTEMNLSNDYFTKDVANVIIELSGKTIFGK